MLDSECGEIFRSAGAIELRRGSVKHKSAVLTASFRRTGTYIVPSSYRCPCLPQDKLCLDSWKATGHISRDISFILMRTASKIAEASSTAAPFLHSLVVTIIPLRESGPILPWSIAFRAEQKREFEKADHSCGACTPNDSPAGGAPDSWSVLRCPRQTPHDIRTCPATGKATPHSRGRPPSDMPTGGHPSA